VQVFAARIAGISCVTALTHRHQDADFAVQCKEAEEYAVDLLQGHAFQRALEGVLEPMYYMASSSITSANSMASSL
jgi:hypothetical protein